MIFLDSCMTLVMQLAKLQISMPLVMRCMTLVMLCITLVMQLSEAQR